MIILHQEKLCQFIIDFDRTEHLICYCLVQIQSLHTSLLFVHFVIVLDLIFSAMLIGNRDLFFDINFN